MFTNILAETKGQVGIIAVNRPKALNALNPATITELLEAVKLFNADAGVRVVVVTGSGEKAFVAGADISEFPKMGKTGAAEFAELGHSLMNAIESSPKPFIAAVNGYALGGGTELALACDFIYASENAVFGLPEVALGIFPGFGGTQRLNKSVGLGITRELIYTGRKIKADEALRVGLANRVVPQASLMEEVLKVAGEIAANSPSAVALVKKVVNSGATLPLCDGLEIEKDKFSECFGTKDMQEGVAAFLEKRRPKWN